MENSMYRSLCKLALVILLALVAMLAGCGAAGSSVGGPSAGGGGQPTATAAVTLPCNGAPTAPSRPPSVTLRNADSGHTVSVAVGAVVEIRLDAAHVWRLGSAQPAGALTPAGAQGALEQGDCVWDFAVAQPGEATIAFVGTALCPPNTMCPQYALSARFLIRAQ